MRIGVASDLHVEFHGTYPDVPKDLDVLILAGDVSTLKGLAPCLNYYAAAVPHVVYVSGNHEYYGCEPEALSQVECAPNVHWLTAEKGVVEIDGVRFAGDTLWFGNPDGLNQIYERYMPDFRAIRAKNVSDWIADRHAKAKAFLHAAQADVFVTHHLPSQRLIAPKWAGSPINRFFASTVFENCQHPPRFWVYGHTHDPEDVTLGDTRFICNPRGYPYERAGKYEVKTIEVTG